MANPTQIAEQLVVALEDEVRDEKSRHQSHLASLAQRLKVAKALLSEMHSDIKAGNALAPEPKSVALSPINGNGQAPQVKLFRAKNMGDLTYQFLRQYPNLTAPELHAKMVDSGASVGSCEYLYTLLKKLEQRGFARHVKDETGTKRYFAVERDDDAKIHVHARTGSQMTQ